MTFNVLIVDDERNIRAGLGRALELDGYRTLLAADGQEALDVMRDEEVDLVIADLKMPRVSGEEVLRRVVDQYPTVPVIILTGHGTIETAVQAMRDGAYDFLTKPVSLERLSLLAKRALSTRELVLQHRQLQQELDSHRQTSAIIGKSTEMQRLMDVVRQVAPTKASVLNHRREWGGQGAHRRRDSSSLRPTGKTAGEGALRGTLRGVVGERAVWARERRVYRGDRTQTGAL